MLLHFARKPIHPKPVQVNRRTIFLLTERQSSLVALSTLLLSSEMEDYYTNKKIEFKKSYIVHKVIDQVIVTGDFCATDIMYIDKLVTHLLDNEH